MFARLVETPNPKQVNVDIKSERFHQVSRSSRLRYDKVSPSTKTIHNLKVLFAFLDKSIVHCTRTVARCEDTVEVPALDSSNFGHWKLDLRRIATDEVCTTLLAQKLEHSTRPRYLLEMVTQSVVGV